ncbi:pseudouridine synthase [Aquimonas sp.]|jgi:16S rRNA pseudouridine516 synthase|uniref:pseudouridine synthase n=1 Tax=Aquimonas sp. TaxID=1872588 RepID=UPI0037C1047E
MRLDRLIANLGYGSRREVAGWCREGFITNRAGTPLKHDANVDPADVLFDGDELDPVAPLVLMLHKPVGYTCSTKDTGRLVYELLPERYRYRTPTLASVGRLDRETSGLLLFTDDGGLLHRIISPKANVPKVYEAELAEPLRGDEAEVFGSGTLLLEGEDAPLKPAGFERLTDTRARLTLHEGRYHQVRRMFGAVGNRVAELHRSAVGGLSIEGLAAGEWRQLDEADLQRLFNAAG